MASRYLLASLFASVILLSIPALGTTSDSVLSVVNSDPSELLLFASALNFSGSAAYFANSSLNVTVFAPSNAAFFAVLGKLGLSQDVLLANAASMKPVLQFHVVPYSVKSNEALDTVKYLPTLLGPGYPALAMTNDGTKTTVISIGSDATVTTADISAGSSKVHIIDNVLLPFYLNINSCLTRFASVSSVRAQLASANPQLLGRLADVNLELTLFVPINAALTAANLTAFNTSAAGMQYLLFSHAVPKPLLYTESITSTPITVYTLSGLPLVLAKNSNNQTTVTLGNTTATIIGSNFPVGFTASGGFRTTVHTIDQVLIPPPPPSGAQGFPPRVDTASILAAVNREGTYANVINSTTATNTYFLPTDKAFQNFFAAANLTLDKLAVNMTILKKIIDVHIITGTAYMTANLTNGTTLSTNAGANSASVVVNVTGIYLTTASGSALIIGGIEYRQGASTVFAIDTVLLPSGITIQQLASTLGNPSSSNPGAAFLAAPSSLVMLLSTVLAWVALYAFSKH